jgi:DNA-binding SARP family transcriptional activator
MTNSDQARTQILLLGRFAVVRGQSSLQAAAWKRRKAAVLLQRLALEHRLLKEQAIDFLWPDASLAAGADNLYRTIYALRQYQACVNALAAELDAPPAPETEALYERILRGELPTLPRPATLPSLWIPHLF